MNCVTHQKSIALYQAMSPRQLAALIRADWRCIEPGWGGEHFCFLKLRQRYAEMLARQWQVPVHGAGYVVRVQLPLAVMNHFELESVAYEEHMEYRIPVNELAQLSDHILGEVEVVSAFSDRQSYSIPAGSRPLAGLID